MWLLSFVLASYFAGMKRRFRVVVSVAAAAFMVALSSLVVEAVAVGSAMQSFS